jgi:threonine synthase
MSFLINLLCSECGKLYDPHVIQTYCQDCQAPLSAVYDLVEARRVLDRDKFCFRGRGMWRWHELLPVYESQNQISLGEGDTPLLPLKKIGAITGLTNLFVKDESLNPTGSFKARGLSAAVSKAKELGVNKVIIPSAGNAGGALAAYAASAGMEARIYMPKDTPIANVVESRIMGAQVILVEGLIDDAARIVGEKAREEDWFDVSTFKEPYRAEGKKIMGYELAEQFGWKLPDVIVYPAGGGTGLIGMWKAFAEMKAMGWLENSRLPRMVAVQSDGCAPIIEAFYRGAKVCEPWENAQTIASGLRVPKSFADKIILKDLTESRGNAISVSDKAILEAQKALASKEGIFAAPEGAATLAALYRLLEDRWLDPEEQIVLFNTGTGLKYIQN